jgi:hypothetical protein
MQIIFHLRRFVSAMLCLSIIGCDHVDEITPRSYVGMLVADTSPTRTAVAQALLSGKPIPDAGSLALKRRGGSSLVLPIDFGWVTVGGVIVAHNKQYGVVVVQEPIVFSGSVKWNCVVYPVAAKPSVCGED